MSSSARLFKFNKTSFELVYGKAGGQEAIDLLGIFAVDKALSQPLIIAFRTTLLPHLGLLCAGAAVCTQHSRQRGIISSSFTLQITKSPRPSLQER